MIIKKHSEQKLIERSKELWDSEYNQKAWVKAVLALGNKWIMLQPVPRNECNDK